MFLVRRFVSACRGRLAASRATRRVVARYSLFAPRCSLLGPGEPPRRRGRRRPHSPCPRHEVSRLSTCSPSCARRHCADFTSPSSSFPQASQLFGRSDRGAPVAIASCNFGELQSQPPPPPSPGSQRTWPLANEFVVAASRGRLGGRQLPRGEPSHVPKCSHKQTNQQTPSSHLSLRRTHKHTCTNTRAAHACECRRGFFN